MDDGRYDVSPFELLLVQSGWCRWQCHRDVSSFGSFRFRASTSGHCEAVQRQLEGILVRFHYLVHRQLSAIELSSKQ